MEEKWICPDCGQENDDLFCIKCGRPKPEPAEAPEEVSAVPEAQVPEAPAEEAAAPAEETIKKAEASTEAATAAAAGKASPKKKSALLKIIIGAAVLVAVIIAILCIFVFGKGKKTYENEMGNYSITVPSGYKMTDCRNGILAESKDAVFFVDYMNADHRNALVYSWTDLFFRDERLPNHLQSVLGLEDAAFRILDPATFGDDDIHSYTLNAELEDGQKVTGEIHIPESKKFGVYLIGYYRKADLSEKKAAKVAEDFQQFLDSFDSDLIPNIPYYELTDLSEMYLGRIAVRSELVSDISVGGSMCLIKDPEGKEEIMMEIILRAKSVAEVFSWEGITDGQIETATTEKISNGRYEYDTYLADYRDKKNNRRAYAIYGIFADNKTPGILAIEYDVSADKKEWAEEVVSDIMWSWDLDYKLYD